MTRAASVIRAVLAIAGLAAAAYGVRLLLDQADPAVGAWLLGGVLVHDAVLAPLVVGLCLLTARVVPRSWLPAVAGGFVVLGSLTLLAVPVLGRFGARPDNPTLLDRDYVTGWLLLAGLTLLAVAAGVLATRTGRSRGGAGSRRR